MFFTMETDWHVSHLRNEVQISIGEEAPTDFIFYYNDGIMAPNLIAKLTDAWRSQ
jgi:hypothetical protein